MNMNIANPDSPSISKRLLKPEEVATILNISRSFAYHLMQTGRIPTVKLGRSSRVRPQDLADYIEQNLHRQAESC